MRLKEKMNELRNERKDLINEIKKRTFYAAFNYCTSGNSLHEDDSQFHK